MSATLIKEGKIKDVEMGRVEEVNKNHVQIETAGDLIN